MIPSHFKIEILAIQDEFVLSGRKGLSSEKKEAFCLKLLHFKIADSYFMDALFFLTDLLCSILEVVNYLCEITV